MTAVELFTPYSLLSVSALAVLLWGRCYEPSAYQLSRHRLQVRKALDRDLKILHLTDTHFRKERKSLTEFFDMLSRDVYDLIFLTGDIIDHLESLPYAAGCLKKLKSRFGFYCVLGNHDYVHYRLIDLLEYYMTRKRRMEGFGRARKIEKMLADAGVRVLRNETLELNCGGQKVMIHALDDPVTGQHRPEELDLSDAQNALEILLTHSVDAVRDMDMSKIDVTFSGHSHGGQVRIPFLGPVVTHTSLGKEYASGIVRHTEQTTCIIGRGLGSNRFVPFRLFCLPEVIELHLQSENEEAQMIRCDAEDRIKEAV